MRIALFGGSFDPIHSEHIGIIEAARAQLALDRVIVIPSRLAPHKAEGAHASGEDRLKMCRIACRSLPYVEVSDFELQSGGTSYTYLTCRHFREQYPDAELFFLVGADMLENFFVWRNPEEIVRLVRIAACGREERLPAQLHTRFAERFGVDFEEVSFTGKAVSSTALRVALAFLGEVEADTLNYIDGEVLKYIEQKGLYRFPEAAALALEKAERRAHSFRVALLACARARSLGVSEEKALIAAMLHDCGKYVPLSSPLLAGFTPPVGVPEPVLHQYTGAFLAENVFHVSDEEILDAIRFHTSGRADMTALEKLIFLADMLEWGRNFKGVEELRAYFFRDIDVCLYAALGAQLAYLNESGKPVYSLTQQAFDFLNQDKE